MLVILFAASCILAVSGQLAGPSQQMPVNLAGIMVPLGQGRMMDLGTVQKPTVEAICNAAVFANKGRVTDAMSDTMGQAISKMMKAIPSFGANPMAMAGTSPKWQCLFQANAGNTAGGISDYFDTVPEITKFVPFFNPCDTVFCGEQGMTPSAIAGAVAASFRRASMGMGPVSQRWLSLFGNQRSKIPTQFTTQRGGMFGPKPPMGGMGSGGANPFMAALGRGMGSGMGSGMGGGMGGMGGMGSGGGLAGMMKMAQQVMGGMANMGGMKNPMTQPLNPAQPSSINSAAATNTNPTPNPSPTPVQTGVSVPANSAASLPPSSSSSSSTPSATPSNAFSNLNPKAITGNPFASMPTAATMSRMMQQMQQLKNQLMGVSMGAANTPKKPAVATPPNTGMPNMGMKSPGMGMTGMPGMGMPGMGMGAPNMGMGMPGMGGMAALMQAAVMGEMMADAPDPVQPRMGMGRGMSGMPFGMGGSMPMMGGQMPFMGQQMPMMGQQMPMMGGGSMGFPFGGGGTGMMGGGFPFGFNPFGSF